MSRQRRHQQALSLSLPPPLPGDMRNLAEDFFLPPPGINQMQDMMRMPSDYEKLGVVGHGSSSSVYKVRHRKTGLIYALKVVRSSGAPMVNPVHEAEILTKVNSDFLLRCHGVMHSAGELCFVMEYMDNGSLHSMLQVHKWLPEAVISKVACCVLNGLKYLHRMQIVHRDIKPSNLLMNSKGEIKIADFGVSTRVMMGRSDSCETGQGTWAYMSPERFDPEKWGAGSDGGDGGSMGFAGDVWSLGVVMLECFLGRHPFIGPGQKLDWATLSCAICFDGAVELPEAASPEFRSFLKRCLEKDWRKRGAVTGLLGHPFINNSTGSCDSSE